MSEPRYDRLQQIVNHLRNGKLAHKNFDFTIVDNGVGNDCGTNGCAVGEFPKIWPEQFFWLYSTVGERENGQTHNPALLASKWLNIADSDARYLFYPDSSGLGNNATKEQVANHIENFINDHV